MRSPCSPRVRRARRGNFSSVRRPSAGRLLEERRRDDDLARRPSRVRARVTPSPSATQPSQPSAARVAAQEVLLDRVVLRALGVVQPVVE